ncbi:hypothetical protein IWQ62_001644 [Dispira parvispora]|uniref:GH16 domain-containing protein n=1 Tax=Dispira parvispora TaxID=1520584 RepID=A0A9W8AT19_9FUNG|nr:hypothetical protein IWQ62_001644 [Dispira parvispora]
MKTGHLLLGISLALGVFVQPGLAKPADGGESKTDQTSTKKKATTGKPANLPEPKVCWKKTWTFDSLEFLDYFDISCPKNIKVINNHLVLKMTEDCTNPGLTYKNAIHYGKATAEMTMANGGGSVTSMVIDFEFVGKDLTSVQSTYYVNGKPTKDTDKGPERHHSPGGDDVNLSKTFETYTIDYSCDRVYFQVGGKTQRKAIKGEVDKYPAKALDWSIDIWNGGKEYFDWAGKTKWGEGERTAVIRKLEYAAYC